MTSSHLFLTEFSEIQIEASNQVALFKKEFGFPDSPPIPVEMLARCQLGLRLEYQRLDSNFKGSLSVEQKTIFVNTLCSHTQRRFTVAHEIGHWVLHDGNESLPEIIGDVCTVPIRRILRSTDAKTKKFELARKESEANVFARSLLIPKSFLTTITSEFSVIDSDSIRELANAFDVSIKTMLIRISNLRDYMELRGTPLDLDSLDALEYSITKRRNYFNQMSTFSYQSDQAPSISTVRSSFDNLRLTPGIQSKRVSAMSKDLFLLRQLLRPRSIEVVTAKHKGTDHRPRSTPLSTTQKLGPCNANAERAEVVGEFFHTLRKTHLLVKDPLQPSIIEFAGTPNSGKDTQIEIVSEYLEVVRDYKVKVIDEAVNLCDIHKHLQVARLFQTVSLVVNQLLDVYNTNSGGYDFIFFNRGPFDRIAFLYSAQFLKLIGIQQGRSHINYLLEYANLIDIVFVLLISPKESLKREDKSVGEFVTSLAKKEDKTRQRNIHNEDVLNSLNKSYRVALERHDLSFNEILFYDNLDNTPILEQAQALTNELYPGHPVQFSLPGLLTFPKYHLTSPNGSSSQTNKHRKGNLSRLKHSSSSQLCLFNGQ